MRGCSLLLPQWNENYQLNLQKPKQGRKQQPHSQIYISYQTYTWISILVPEEIWTTENSELEGGSQGSPNPTLKQKAHTGIAPAALALLVLFSDQLG